MAVAHGTLTPFGDGVWIDTAPVRFLGMRLTATMTVFRLGDGSLLLYSPIAMTAERRAAIESLGTVAHLYAPNLYHHLRVGDWAARFPSARLHAPAQIDEMAARAAAARLQHLHQAERPLGPFRGIGHDGLAVGFACRLWRRSSARQPQTMPICR